MPTTKVTANQVARKAGVSQSAVSRTFTPGASISVDLREKVERAARELKYRPNVLAQAMITGRSRIIGLVVAYLDNQFYPEAIEKLSVALQEQGYQVLVFMGVSTVGDLEHVIDEILSFQVDGIILASVSLTSNLAQLCDNHGIPVVLFNRDQDDDRLCAVTADNYGGGKLIAQHLVAGGHERFGYIAGFEGATTQRERERGFRDGLAEAGADIAFREVGGFTYAGARAAALEMFTGGDRPDAVFVCNDHMAFAVMDVLRLKLGLRVPGDVSVAGFDDVPIAAWPSFDLTSYRQPINQMVDRTVLAMLARIDNPDAAPVKASVEGRLILRGSTRKEGS
ncbi:LacI family transcriptional regulator [Jannaschia sp. EhC01]|nr:LacI family transcriptional regulator [Jannaschia sp. EhC01]